MDVIAATIREWRDLGFHYDRDDVLREWTISETRRGINGFSAILRRFAADERNDIPFEHDHLGPYGYLKIMNVPGQRGFDSSAIVASRQEFAELADVIDETIASAQPGQIFRMKAKFCPESAYELVLSVRDDGFDPGLFDPWVAQKLNEQSDAQSPQTGEI